MEINPIYGGKGIELLAPAGNLSCALAAFDAGANAVYCGLKRFNARERTENFTHDEMAKLLAYAHKHGKKVYITFNTLIKESELPAMAEELAALADLRPDSLIIQDLGVLYAVKHYFPEFTLHGSTQMGFHNSGGLLAAEKLGISRVILERQSTLSEIAMMRKACPQMELEVFIHGALCACISGTCLFSSWLGGWSGNRGKCKQPCRRRFHSDHGNGFFLSAQDLCTIEIIPQIAGLGVKAMKIEGRLRRSDYVAEAVSAYRMVLDAKDEAEFKEILPRAKECLARTCGRRWSLGYYTTESRNSLVKFDSIGASGLLAGKVAGITDRGFKVSVIRGFSVGDTIRVQPDSGEEGPAVRITKMSVNGKPASHVRHGELALIHYDQEIPAGAFVYKTGSAETDYSARIAEMPSPQKTFRLNVQVTRSGITLNAGTLHWEKALELQEASNRPLDPENIKREFLQHDCGFAIGEVVCSTEGNPFLPASLLKAVRQEFAAYGKAHPANTDDDTGKRRNELLAFCRSLKAPESETVFRDCAVVPRGMFMANKDCTFVREMQDEPSPHEELLLPHYVPETGLAAEREAVEKYLAKGGRTIRLSSLHQLPLIPEKSGLTLKTCMPLPVCNSLAVLVLAGLGFRQVQGWIELEKAELEALIAHSVLPVEIYRYGRPVLLTTRAAVEPEKRMTDARGDVFLIDKNRFATRIYAGKVMAIPMPRGAANSFRDYRMAHPGESETGDFNYSHTLN